VAEELDLPAEKVVILAGDSGTSLNQGGASGSTGVSHGGATLRNAAAEARYVMLEIASKQLNVPMEDLVTANGVISSKNDASKKITYAEVVGGKWFETDVEWNGQIGNNLSMKTRAKLKDPKDYKVYGTSAPRRDVEYKMLGTDDYVVDIKVPGMLHARTIMPPRAGWPARRAPPRSIPPRRGRAPLPRLQAARQLARLPHARGVALPRHVPQVVERQRARVAALGGALKGEGPRAELPGV
jgi:CO/xanthine dehydrogenase Mo-binding subunit